MSRICVKTTIGTANKILNGLTCASDLLRKNNEINGSNELLRMRDNFIKYSHLRSTSVEDDDFIIDTLEFWIFDTEYEYISESIEWYCLYGRKEGYNKDYSKDLIDAHNEYYRKREEERRHILDRYKAYLESDLVDARGKKSKKHFAEINGYAPNYIYNIMKN